MNDDNEMDLEGPESPCHNEGEPGFYGKLPSKGDFVTRRLPQRFVEVWDTWLQNGLQTSQESLGEDWLSIYMTSPIWRFALSAGVGGPRVMTGVLMPSVDRVGRYFPLTLTVELEGCRSIAGLPKQASAWYAQAEDAALTALEEGSDFEDVDARIQALGMPDHRGTGMPLLDREAGESGLRIAVDPSDGFAPDPTTLLDHFLRESYPRYCFWWTAGSEKVVPSMLVSAGLPSMGAFVAFLDGQWRESGWVGGVADAGDTSLHEDDLGRSARSDDVLDDDILDGII